MKNFILASQHDDYRNPEQSCRPPEEFFVKFANSLGNAGRAATFRRICRGFEDNFYEIVTFPHSQKSLVAVLLTNAQTSTNNAQTMHKQAQTMHKQCTNMHKQCTRDKH